MSNEINKISHNITHEFVERRSNHRFFTNLSAKILLGENELCKCVIKDLSNSGARLLVLNRNWVPRSFLIDGLITGKHLLVSRIWQDTQEIGVEFSAGNIPVTEVIKIEV